MIVKKLEYRFKHSDAGKAIIARLNSDDSFDREEVKMLLNKKLEYTFKNSECGKQMIEEIIK